MYLDKNKKNRYTVGKLLRKEKKLRKKDQTAKVMPFTPQLEAYKRSLEEKGMVVGPLDVGIFQTKNGLQYPGFIAKETIVANSVLLRVPVDCLLTTRDAFQSQIQKVFIQNPRFYAKTFTSDWQDRIILTYLLFEFQKGQKSKWHHLLQNLPRDIDYVAFWPQSELQYLEDDWVRKSIEKERSRVLKQQQELITIAKKYPQYFDINYFTPQNITWIHVHLVTRCFGKYFQYTTMVPYAELFNHQCVDVYYTMAYNKDNPHDPHEELSEPKFITQAEQQQADTSEGSYDASDVSCSDDDFQETEVPKLQLQCSSSVLSQFKTLNSYLIAFINFNDEVSLPFLEKTYFEMQSLMKEQQKVALERFAKVHSKNVKYLKLVKQFFVKIGSNRYSYGLRQRKIWKAKQNKSESTEVDPDCNYFEGTWPKDKFDQFLMVCGSKDQFEPGSQVYFCYGRLPNRLLLMRYGIALEHNKYNHIFIRIDISGFVYKSASLQRIIQQQISLKKYRRFKLKRTVFCIELLTFHRSLYWKYQEDPETIFFVHDLDREKHILKLVKEILTKKLEDFTCTLQQNQKKLWDHSVGYHQYFAVVYRLQQQRILIEQNRMIDYALSLIEEIESGATLQSVLRAEKHQSKLRMQIMMEVYLKTFRCF